MLREDAGSVGESGSQVVPLQQGEREVSDSLQVRRRGGQVHRDVREGAGDRRRERTRRRKIRLLARWLATVLLQHHRGRAQVLGACKVQRLSENILGLVPRVREIQIGNEELGEEASGEFAHSHFVRTIFVKLLTK